MEGLPFIDTNVFLRHIAGDEASQTPRATAFLERIELEQIAACTIDTVIFETVFTLLTFYRMPREAVHEALVPLIRLPGLRVPHRRELVEAFDLFVEHRRLSYADCYHAIMARRLNASEFISFDRGFDRLSWIIRTEPA